MAKKTGEGNADKRVSGIIFMVIGLFVLVLLIKEQLDLPQTMAQAQNAAYVTDGQVDPENDGKLVIVTGTLTQNGDAEDTLLGLHFDAPALYRVVEKYELDSTIGDGVWSWEKQYSDSAEELACGYVTGKVTLGEFTLAEDILSAFPTDSYYADFSEEALTQAGLHTEAVGDIVYITQATGVSQGTTYSIWGLMGDGDVRVSYRYYDVSQQPTITLIAYQEGDTLTLANFEDVSFDSVMPGTLTKEEFLSAASDDLTQTNLWFILAAAALTAYGAYQFGKYYFQKKKC